MTTSPRCAADPALPRAIYCVLCPSYHGSTLLALALGNHSRALALGDTIPVVRPPLVCGCGRRIAGCAFWREVGDGVTVEGDRLWIPVEPRLLAAPDHNATAVELAALLGSRLGIGARFGRFAAAHRHYWAVCRRHYDFDVFIDGFKVILRYLALKANGFPIRGVVHLLRDPRAFAAASKRAGVPVAEAAEEWCAMHGDIERQTGRVRERVIRVRYEELCERPAAVLGGLQRDLGLEPEDVMKPIAPGLHWLGNASMLRFDGRFRRSDRWRAELDEGELERIRTIARGTAAHYGYDLDH